MKKERIMVVEDEIVTARSLQMSLEKLDYVVTAIISSGEQAIQKLEDGDCPDLVLMDISLQGKIDGIETAEIINTRFDLPVIYLTSSVDISVFEKAKTTNPYGYITKPSKKEALQKVIELGLYRHRSDKERRMLVIELEKEIVKRNRIEKELEIRVRQQNVIAYLGYKALLSMDTIDFMNKVVKKVADTLDNEYCNILELLPDDMNMLLLAGIGWEKDLLGHTKIKSGLDTQEGYTLNSSKPVIVDNLKAETQFYGTQLLHKYNIVSGMSIVIQGKDGPWGILETYSIKQKTFSKNDINFLHSIANLLASAIARKKVEETLKESEEKYRKLIETAQDAIVCVENGKITIWNKSAEKIFGYLKSEIIGKPVSTIIPERFREGHQKGMKQFLESGKASIMDKIVEFSGKSKDGIEFPIEMSLSYQKTKDKHYTFTAILRDITSQKQTTEQLIEKSKEIEKINKELKDFVYTVSHDLKEPLFSIDGYNTRLYKTYKDTYDEKGRKFSNRIKANIEIMSNRIKEILEVTKIGMITYDFKVNNTGNIVKEVLTSLEDQIESNNINTIINHNLPTILCDGKRISDVFCNLVTNAIKFMGDDKQRQITIGCNKDGDNNKFYVEDTGIGIRKESQENLFKIFSRLKEIEAEGTGVGLIIAKKIVELHKGTIAASNRLNKKGAQVEVLLPKFSL